MPNNLSLGLKRKLRKKRRSRRDFTKDNSVKWFALILFVIAIIIIVDTLSGSDNVEQNKGVYVQSSTPKTLEESEP